MRVAWRLCCLEQLALPFQAKGQLQVEGPHGAVPRALLPYRLEHLAPVGLLCKLDRVQEPFRWSDPGSGLTPAMASAAFWDSLSRTPSGVRASSNARSCGVLSVTPAARKVVEEDDDQSPSIRYGVRYMFSPWPPYSNGVTAAAGSVWRGRMLNRAGRMNHVPSGRKMNAGREAPGERQAAYAFEGSHRDFGRFDQGACRDRQSIDGEVRTFGDHRAAFGVDNGVVGVVLRKDGLDVERRARGREVAFGNRSQRNSSGRLPGDLSQEEIARRTKTGEPSGANSWISIARSEPIHQALLR